MPLQRQPAIRIRNLFKDEGQTATDSFAKYFLSYWTHFKRSYSIQSSIKSPFKSLLNDREEVCMLLDFRITEILHQTCNGALKQDALSLKTRLLICAHTVPYRIHQGAP